MGAGGAAASGAGGALLLALFNAWLAGRRDRSRLAWFLGSLLLAPLAWLFTIYLLLEPAHAGPSDDPDAPAMGLAAALLWTAIVLVLLFVVLMGGQIIVAGPRA